jgi:hypothetical protein
MEAKKQMDSFDYKYDKGHRVFTEDSAKKNRAPYEILERHRHGNQLMWEGEPWRSKKIIDPETGKAKRTPYEPAYRVRGEIGEMILPESAIKGRVDLAKGGIAHMADGGQYRSVMEDYNQPPRLPTAEEEAIEPVYPEEYLIGSGFGKSAINTITGLGNKVLSSAEMALRPAVKNDVVVSKGISLKSFPIRMPNSDKDITYAYRNMSQAEYDAAKKSGYFEANPYPKYEAGTKWWSGGDELGKFGREWKGGKDVITVRVPRNKVPENKAVRFKDVEQMKHGGVAHMDKGGSMMRDLEEYIRQKRGEHGAKRVQRAADEIPGLESMYTPKALKHTFERQNAGLMTMNPADFERFAEKLGRFADENSIRHTTTGQQLNFNDYLKHLENIRGGFNEVPFLELGHRDPEYLPSIEGHEGRHRSRALTNKGVQKSLVQLMPSARMGLSMPKKNSEKLVQKLRQTLGENRFVSPQGGSLLPADQNAQMYKWLKENNYLDANRPQLPDVYKRGGRVTHAHHLDIEERPL